MSTNEVHRLKVHITGLEQSRGHVNDLALMVEGAGPEIKKIRLKPQISAYVLALPAGTYRLDVKFSVGSLQFSRSLSGIKVPPATAVEFDLAQAVADKVMNCLEPARPSQKEWSEVTPAGTAGQGKEKSP